MHDFNDLEGLRIAIEMEKRGEALYRKAARVSKKREVVDMLTALATDEVAHAAEFSRLYEEALSRRAEHASYGEEASAYLSAVAADIVFPDGLMALREEGFDNVRAVLDYAIASEKDSILDVYKRQATPAWTDPTPSSWRLRARSVKSSNLMATS